MDYIKYLSDQKELFLNNADYLKKEDRVDEANFEKIRSNIYDIAISAYKVHGLKENGDKNYIGFLLRIKENWFKDKEKYDEHEDFERSIIEEIKLNELDKILEDFEKRKGDK